MAFEEAGKPYGRHYQQQIAEVLETCDAHFFVASPIGPVPIELDEMYPVAQSLFPSPPDLETKERIREQMEHLSHEHTVRAGGGLGRGGDHRCPGHDVPEASVLRHGPGPGPGGGRLPVRQGGRGRCCSTGKVELKKSETTGKIQERPGRPGSTSCP